MSTTRKIRPKVRAQPVAPRTKLIVRRKNAAKAPEPARGAAGVRLYKSARRRFMPLRGTPEGSVDICRDVETDVSDTMACGIVVHNKRLPWTIRYDEYYLLIDGKLAIRVGRKAYRLGIGDAIWLPASTALVYEPSPRATVIYAVYPIDWRKRAGME